MKVIRWNGEIDNLVRKFYSFPNNDKEESVAKA